MAFPWLQLAQVAGQANIGLAQADAIATQAMQEGAVGVSRFGPFGSAAQDSLARSSQAVFANQTPGALLALNADGLAGFGESYASRLASGILTPAGDAVGSIPTIGWIAIAVVAVLLLRRR